MFRKNRTIIKIVFVVMVVLVLSVTLLPIIPDPYYHEELVCFWEWLWREIDEQLWGERMIMITTLIYEV